MNCKLALLHHGPFHVLEVHSNCLLVHPVDKPREQLILVSMDRATICQAGYYVAWSQKEAMHKSELIHEDVEHS